MIIVNLKTYEQALGRKAIELAESCAKVAQDTGARIVVAPQHVDLRCTARDTGAEVWAQHVDDVTYGKFTGWLSPEAAKDAGVKGVIINHAEHQLPEEQIVSTIKKVKALGLQCCVCVDSVELGERIKGEQPEFIAIEVPELIGGNISISTANPEIVEEAVRRLETDSTKVIAGAGIKTGEDVKAALKLGAKGIILASGVVLAESPEVVLIDFAKAFGGY